MRLCKRCVILNTTKRLEKKKSLYRRLAPYIRTDMLMYIIMVLIIVVGIIIMQVMG